MQYDVKKCLQEIIDHVEEMNEMLSDVSGFKASEQDAKARRATERLFEIIGEATKRALQSDSNLIISDAPKIIEMRNRIAHGYDAVDTAVLWNTYKKYVPQLRQEAQQLLDAM
jgi:uncharacterized protein with HEPN domain